MNLTYLNTPDFSFFSDATKQIDHMIGQLRSDVFCDNEHGDIEQYIQKEGFEVLRCLFQGYLDLKAANEKSISDVYTEQGIHLTHTKNNTKRTLAEKSRHPIVLQLHISKKLCLSKFTLPITPCYCRVVGV